MKLLELIGMIPIEIEAPAEMGLAGNVWIEETKKQIVLDSEQVDRLLNRIRAKLIKMQKSSYKVFLERDDLKNAEVWYGARFEYLQWVSGLFEPYFSDGGGI